MGGGKERRREEWRIKYDNGSLKYGTRQKKDGRIAKK